MPEDLSLEQTGSPSLSSRLLAVACHLEVRLCEISPVPLAYQLQLSFSRFYVSSHIVAISWVYFPCPIEKTQSGSQLPGPLAIAIFLLPLLWCFLNLRCMGCFVGFAGWSWALYGHLFSGFWLLVSFCNGFLLLPKEFFYEGWKHLSMGVNASMWNAVWNYTDVGKWQ